MRAIPRTIRIAALLLPISLSGCLWHTRKLPVPKPPAIVQTATPDDLVAQINQRWDRLQTLNATVEIQASKEKSAQGLATDYTSFRGFILLRKPDHLRVLGLVPVIGSTMFDMATDGKKFTLYVPSKNKAIEGPNSVKKKSANQLENLRPEFFIDAVTVRGLDPEDHYSVTADTETVEDASKKHLLVKPEYVLNIMRPKSGSHEEKAVRVITLDRTTMLPYQQDLYDEDGNLATHVTYSDYKDFGFGLYPGTITIRRPQEEFQITLAVQKVTQNMDLSDDQFVVKMKPGTQVQNLE